MHSLVPKKGVSRSRNVWSGIWTSTVVKSTVQMWNVRSEQSGLYPTQEAKCWSVLTKRERMSYMLRADIQILLLRTLVSKTLRARLHEDENVPDCDRGGAHAMPIVCLCGMQTGSQGRANTQNKSWALFFFSYLKPLTKCISFSSWSPLAEPGRERKQTTSTK